MDLLKDGCKERVYPVGRLDKSSLGVLLITNDGDIAKKLTHPSFLKKKVYQVQLERPVTKADMDAIVQGIELEDGEVHADAISYVGPSRNEVGIEIHSGRNRIVRRIFEHLGYRVVKLDRVYFAGLTKQKLKRGQWRFLTPREVQALRTGQYE
jgi:23S rRNA pseudouridine2605 synthase